MNTADKQYIKIAKRILKKGELVPTRCVYADGTQAFAKRLWDQSFKFDLRKEIPILKSKQMFPVTCYKELNWIWVMGSNDVRELQKMGVTVWDEWMLPDGTIGKAYGYQARQVDDHIFDDEGNYVRTEKIDQVKNLIEGIKRDPFGRRHIVNFWNVADLKKMSLVPCAYETHWFVTKNGYLNCKLIQRSGDLGLGVPFNMTQYALLVHMIAQITGLKPGFFKHEITDCHIYDRHLDLITLQFDRPEIQEEPTVWLNPDIKNFDDFTIKDVKIKNYKYHEKIEMEIAK
jgi:thymidylate synthase